MYNTLRQISSFVLSCSGNRKLTSAPIKRLIEENVISFTGGNRTINRDQVEKIKAGMVFHLLGTLRLALFEDGTLNILDGQHRYVALTEKFDEIPEDETIILEIIPVDDDVEFLQLLRMMNETIPFTEGDYASSIKYSEVKMMINERYLPIVQKRFNIRTLFGTNRPRINENDFSKIKRTSYFREHSAEEIFDKLVELNSRLERMILEGDIDDEYTRRYQSLGFYLWRIANEWQLLFNS